MATIFRISEVPPVGQEGDGGPFTAQFAWTSAKRADDPAAGGGRACPRDVMDIAGKQIVVRTKNPGSVFPSFQVLGPDREPITLHGLWDDRYNFEGYAAQEMQAFDEMCRRGNMVRVSVDQQGWFGIITDWKFSYMRRWYIGYQFTLSIRSRDDEKIKTSQPPEAKDPGTILAGLNRQGEVVAATNYRRPEASTYGAVMSAIRSGLGAVSDGLLLVANLLDTRTGVLKPIGDFGAIASQMRGIQGNCSSVLNSLVTARADVSMTVRTAKDVLDFEAWSKSMGSQLRLLRYGAAGGAHACEQRSVGASVGTYRPRKGQSLYSVSQAVYGTPFAWKLIYDANHLHSTYLTGTETLTIPARGAVAA
jgi:nucleoid-associated protein YgaU